MKETESKESMRVLRFQANNVLRLSVVDITTDKGVVVIGGRNAQGKSSVLNSIMAAVGGGKNRPKTLLKQGAKKGSVTLEIGDKETKYILTLNVTPSGEQIILKTAEGAKFNGAQSMLDGWWSSIAFDPLSFLRMKPAEQLDTLKALVGLDFTELDQERKRLFEQRTEINRDAKAAKANMDAIELTPDLPEEEVSIEELNKKLQDANEANNANSKKRDELDNIKTAGKILADSLKETEDEITRLENALNEAMKRAKSQREDVDKLRASYATKKAEADSLKDIDTQPIIDQINGVEQTNRKIRRNKQRETWHAQYVQQTDAANELTLKLESIDTKKRDALTKAAFPVPGLSFDETDVLYNGIAFDQASSREKIHVATAIAMAGNQKLNVMLCREGSMLDEDGKAQLKALALKHGYQLWLEVVGNPEDASIIIEDGAVKEVR